jgi:hypothetical protein
MNKEEKLYINNDQRLGFTDVVISQEDVIKMYRELDWDIKQDGTKMDEDDIIDNFLDHDVFDIPKGFTEEQGRLMLSLIEENDFCDNDAEEIVERMIDLNVDKFTIDSIVIYSTIEDYTEFLVDSGTFGNVDKRLYEYIDFDQMGSDIVNLDCPSHILDFDDEEYRIVEILK